MMVPNRPTATATTSAMMPTKKRVGGPGGAAPPEVPIFLQKAYHMIDTCDTKICCWSEDGQTFIVKNTSLFETTIIPQFFKHNKFSSFVRQLNFYGFRKVKFSNSLRIDHKLEKETAKFWRFRHDKFRKGRKDLLVEIKRTPSSSASGPSAPSSAMASSALMNKAIVPSAVSSSSHVQLVKQQQQQQQQNNKPEEVTHLKSEMQVLKQRLECMTKNIDELTDMVKKVSVKDEQQEEGENKGGVSSVVSPGAAKVEPEATPAGMGNKRKKMEVSPVAIKREILDDEDTVMNDLPIMPDWNPSSSELTGAVDSLFQDPLPDLALSGSVAGSASMLPNAPSPVPSDDAFVDDLFQAFADEDAIIPGLEGCLENETSMADQAAENDNSNPNKPDSQLMKRIEDSLSTIPKDMHEMVANKLIDAISNTQPIAESYSSVEEGIKSRSISVDQSLEKKVQFSPQVNQPLTATTTSPTSSIPLPLAVATLKTILSEYGLKISEDPLLQQQKQAEAARRSRSNSPCSKDVRRANRSQGFSNSLPVVPMHA